MKYDKSFLRKKFLSLRKKNYYKFIDHKFDYNLVFKLIKKIFKKKKITIAGYYPSYYEADIIDFLNLAAKKNFKIVLPVIKSSNKMSFMPWNSKDPLYVSKFGTLEPENLKNKIVPDLIMVPLVAFDKNLNRIGYGKGYYDRSLQKINKVKKKLISVGVAYSFQKCARVPIDNNDFKLDYIFTERGIIKSN